MVWNKKIQQKAPRSEVWRPRACIKGNKKGRVNGNTKQTDFKGFKKL